METYVLPLSVIWWHFCYRVSFLFIYSLLIDFVWNLRWQKLITARAIILRLALKLFSVKYLELLSKFEICLNIYTIIFRLIFIDPLLKYNFYGIQINLKHTLVGDNVSLSCRCVDFSDSIGWWRCSWVEQPSICLFLMEIIGATTQSSGSIILITIIFFYINIRM